MTTETDANANAKPVATGLQLTELDEAFARDPYPVLAEVRSREPVHYDSVIKRWILTRFDDIDAVLRDRTMAVDARKAAPGTYMTMFAERAATWVAPTALCPSARVSLVR
jgi:cytochrome P450